MIESTVCLALLYSSKQGCPARAIYGLDQASTSIDTPGSSSQLIITLALSLIPAPALILVRTLQDRVAHARANLEALPVATPGTHVAEAVPSTCDVALAPSSPEPAAAEAAVLLPAKAGNSIEDEGAFAAKPTEEADTEYTPEEWAEWGTQYVAPGLALELNTALRASPDLKPSSVSSWARRSRENDFVAAAQERDAAPDETWQEHDIPPTQKLVRGTVDACERGAIVEAWAAQNELRVSTLSIAIFSSLTRPPTLVLRL